MPPSAADGSSSDASVLGARNFTTYTHPNADMKSVECTVDYAPPPTCNYRAFLRFSSLVRDANKHSVSGETSRNHSPTRRSDSVRRRPFVRVADQCGLATRYALGQKADTYGVQRPTRGPMHDLSITNCVVGFLCIAALPACSLLIATHERQCKSDADCTTSGLGTLCVDQVCVDGPSSSGCQGDTCNLESAAATRVRQADHSRRRRARELPQGVRRARTAASASAVRCARTARAARRDESCG
jgi:hypothetical protein